MRLGWWCYEITTPLTQGTYEAARSAVDVALTAADHVLDGERVAYGLCRPPGHHAARAMYGGYCFFNNAAVVAQHVAATTGGKVSVLDVDYHHGNGTQQIFYDRADVQFVSLHGDPAAGLPVPDRLRRRGRTGAGRGATSNFPLAAGHATTSSTSTCCARRATRSSRSLPTWSSCRSGSTRTSTTRSATWPHGRRVRGGRRARRQPRYAHGRAPRGRLRGRRARRERPPLAARHRRTVTTQCSGDRVRSSSCRRR